MGFEPVYRIAAGYLVLMHFGVLLLFARRRLRGETGFKSASRLLLVGAWLGLVVAATLSPTLLGEWEFEMIEVVRWLATAPSLIGTALVAWALRSRLELDTNGQLAATGAYQWCRYPADGGMAIHIFGIGVFSANYVVLGMSIAAILLLRACVPAQQERHRKKKLGEPYSEFATSSGVFLPSADAVAQREYTVPSRFGLTAILGLLTMLAVIFGALRYSNAPPLVYLFIGSEILGICLAQIFLGSGSAHQSSFAGPRLGSALTGAVLLPFWTYLMLDIPPIAPLEHLAIVSCLVAFGGLIGYIVGALAAGFFLVMDLLEALFTTRDSYPMAHEQAAGEVDT